MPHAQQSVYCSLASMAKAVLLKLNSCRRKQVLLDDQEAANGSQGLPGSSPNGQNEVKQTLLVESNN